MSLVEISCKKFLNRILPGVRLIGRSPDRVISPVPGAGDVGMKRVVVHAAMPSPNDSMTSDERLRLPQRRLLVQLHASIDDLVHHSHPARALWDVLTLLDLSAFHETVRARTGVRGRDATDPRVHLGLWGMAAWMGVSSAREIATLAESNPGLCWIRGGVTVNHPMLSSFRSRHAPHFEPTLRPALTATLILSRIAGWWPTVVFEQESTSSTMFFDGSINDLGWARAMVDVMITRLQTPKRGRPSVFLAGQNHRSQEQIDARRQSMAQTVLARVLQPGKSPLTT